MKKTLLFLALIPAVLFAGEWRKQLVEADELLGTTESYYNFVFQDGESAFFFRTDKADHFNILGPHVFDTTYDRGRTFCKVRVGLYDNEGKIVDSFDMYLSAKNNQYTAIGTFECDFMSQPIGQQKNTCKIFKHLRGTDGYVRFVTNTYSHGRFDLRVNPIDIE